MQNKMQPVRCESFDSARRSYFTDSPVPMAEFPVSVLEEVVRFVEETRATGTEGAREFCARCTSVEPNAAMVRLLAAGDREEVQNHLRDIVSGGRGADLLGFAKTLLWGPDGGTSAEVSLRRFDGGALRIRLHASRTSPSADTVLLSASEITGEDTLREQLNLLSMLPETNPAMVFVLEASEVVLYMNPAARRWLRERDVKPIEGIRILVPETPSAGYSGAASQEPGKPILVEDRDRRYRTTVASIPGTNRRMITAADVTEEHQLRVERDVFERAFEMTSNPMLITDDEERIEYVNAAFSRYYGYDVEDVRGRTPAVLNPGRAAYNDLGVDEAEYEKLFRGMRTSLAEHGHHEADVANRSADGTVRWIRAILSRITVADDAPPKYLGIHVDVDEMRRREEAARLEILETIAKVGELRDNETGRHMHRVGLYARRIAETLGMPAKYCSDIQVYAPLHDIGKVGISDEILLAPRKLSDEEFEIIKGHTTLGYGILSDAASMEMAADIALGHHERFEGNGYPHGVSNDAIPWSARIVAIADVYDALRGERPYKKAWDHQAAVREILSLTGRQFCPTVVEAFRKVESDFEQISVSYAD